jgi:hypothetical protein
VELLQTDRVPVIVGKAFTVKVEVTAQLLEFLYVIVTEPIALAITSPVLLIVATAVFDEFHGKLDAGTPEPVN